MVTSLVKKKIIAGDDKGERSAPSMPLDYHYLTALQLYGELVVVSAFGHFFVLPICAFQDFATRNERRKTV